MTCANGINILQFVEDLTHHYKLIHLQHVQNETNIVIK